MYESFLKKNNLSVTKNRIELLRALDAVNKPVTIETLKESLEIDMDTSTMYRSLRILAEKGVIYQTDFREGVSYFEFQGDHHHHHFVCTKCKTQESIDLCVQEKFPELEKQKKIIITNHIFEIFGTCKNCL